MLIHWHLGKWPHEPNLKDNQGTARLLEISGAGILQKWWYCPHGTKEFLYIITPILPPPVHNALSTPIHPTGTLHVLVIFRATGVYCRHGTDNKLAQWWIHVPLDLKRGHSIQWAILQLTLAHWIEGPRFRPKSSSTIIGYSSLDSPMLICVLAWILHWWSYPNGAQPYSPYFPRCMHITTWSVSDSFLCSLTAGHMYPYQDNHHLFQVQVPSGYKIMHPGCGAVDAIFSSDVLCLACKSSTAVSFD